MRVIISGTRRIWSTSLVRDAIRDCGFPVTFIVSGGARGIDQAAQDVAVIDRIPFQIYPADWLTYDNAAGMIRNKQMADHPADALIALPDAESIGTRGMIRIMEDRKLPVYVREL